MILKLQEIKDFKYQFKDKIRAQCLSIVITR